MNTRTGLFLSLFLVCCCLLFVWFPLHCANNANLWIYDWIELSIAANGYIQHFNSLFFSLLLLLSICLSMKINFFFYNGKCAEKCHLELIWEFINKYFLFHLWIDSQIIYMMINSNANTNANLNAMKLLLDKDEEVGAFFFIKWQIL